MSENTGDTVAAEVIGIVAEVLAMEPGRLDVGTRAQDVAGWDSLALVRMVFALEAAFPVRFTLAEIEGIDGIAPLIAVVGRKAKPVA